MDKPRETRPRAPPSIAAICTVKVTKATMARFTHNSRGKHESHTSALKQVDAFIIRLAQLTSTKALSGLYKVVGNQCIRLLHHHHRGVETVTPDDEENAPEGTAVLQLRLSSSSIAESLMCARRKGVQADKTIRNERHHPSGIHSGMYPWHVRVPQIDAEGNDAMDAFIDRADGRREFTQNDVPGTST